MGGAPLNREFAQKIGADHYTDGPQEMVEILDKLDNQQCIMMEIKSWMEQIIQSPDRYAILPRRIRGSRCWDTLRMKRPERECSCKGY